MILNKEEKKLIIELICNEQTHMIIKDHNKYEYDKYKKLHASNGVKSLFFEVILPMKCMFYMVSDFLS